MCSQAEHQTLCFACWLFLRFLFNCVFMCESVWESRCWRRPPAWDSPESEDSRLQTILHRCRESDMSPPIHQLISLAHKLYFFLKPVKPLSSIDLLVSQNKFLALGDLFITLTPLRPSHTTWYLDEGQDVHPGHFHTQQRKVYLVVQKGLFALCELSACLLQMVKVIYIIWECPCILMLVNYKSPTLFSCMVPCMYLFHQTFRSGQWMWL